MSGTYLNSNDEVYEIIKAPRTINNPDALPDWKQTIWMDLIGLSGNEYQEKLAEAKVHWVRKTKLSSDL